MGPDFEQIAELLHQRAVGLKDGGLAVPNVRCFTAGAVDFDYLEATAFLKFSVIWESHIESAKIEFRYLARNSIESRYHLIGDVGVSVAKDGTAAMAAGKGQPEVLVLGDDGVELLFVALEVNMLDKTCAPVPLDQFPQG